jgi:hypothetical protein
MFKILIFNIVMNYSNIILRLNKWMNYSADDNELLQDNIFFRSYIENNNIVVYESILNIKVATINFNLSYNIEPQNYIELDNNKFILLQYTNSLLLRILSTI